MTISKWIGKNKSNIITFGIIIVMFLVVFFLDSTKLISRQDKGLLVPIGINIILAVSLNLVVGFLGELALGHAAFLSLGAYSGCMLSIKLQDALPTLVRLPICMIFGGLVAAFFGILIGIPVLRLKGDYLAIVTLAFGEIVLSVITNLEFTGGPSGLQGTPQDINYIIVFVVIIIMLFVILNFVNSRHGRAIMSIRDNRIASESVGINITYYKLLAFVLAAFFAGIAGVILGHNISIVDASKFDYNRSIEILVFVVLGGIGSIRGSIIAATIITILPEKLRGLQDYRLLTYAVVLIAMMVLNSNPKFVEFKSNMFKPVKNFFSSKRVKGGAK